MVELSFLFAEPNWKNKLLENSIRLIKSMMAEIYNELIKIKFKDLTIIYSDRKIVESNIKLDSTISFEYIIMNIFATVVVCCGIVQNNTSVVIGGAMLAMLLGPILGVSLSLIKDDDKLLRESFSEAIGALIVLSISYVFAKIYNSSGQLLFENSLSHYTSPNILDLIIAMIGGAAGTYVTVIKQRGVGMVAVALSITLVPPLAGCGIYLAQSNFLSASNAFFLFFANFVGIQFASLLILVMFGFYSSKHTNETTTVLTRGFISTILIVCLTFILGYNLKKTLESQRFEHIVREKIAVELKPFKGAYLTELLFKTGKKPTILAVIRTPTDLTARQIATLDDHLPLFSDKKVELHVQTLKITELTRDVA